MVKSIPPFHLAIPVDDLAAAEGFYGSVLNCPKGRESPDWIDFDFFGHQLVVHLSPDACAPQPTSQVDGVQVPVRHFGAVLAKKDWERIAARLHAAQVPFLIEPTTRHQSKPGEQGTFFVCDPAGNALEFKWFANDGGLFAR